MPKRSLKKNFAYNVIYQILLALTPLITTPYLARVLGPASSGIYSYTYSIANYFFIFATLGISTYGVRAVAQCGDDRGLRSRAFCGVYASQLLVGCMAFLFYFLYIVFVHEGGIKISLVWVLYVLSAVLDVSWLLFGCEEFRVPTMRSIATKLMMVATILLFVHSADDLWLYCLATAGSFFLNAALIWPFVRRYVDFARPTFAEVLGHLRGNAGLFIPVVAVSLYTTLNDVLLGALATTQEVAFYDYSYKISRILLHVVTALGTVMLPRMAALLKGGERERGLAVLDTSIWAMFSVSFALMFGIIAVAPEFTPVFFGDGYESCVLLMSLLGALIPVVTVTNVIGRQYLLPLGRDADYTKSILCGAAANVLLALLLVPFLGSLGATIGTMAADIAILIYQAFNVRKELPLKGYLKTALPFAVIGLIMLVVVRAASAVCPFHGFALLMVEVGSGVVTYAALSLVWCLVTKDEQFIRLFGRYIPGLKR